MMPGTTIPQDQPPPTALLDTIRLALTEPILGHPPMPTPTMPMAHDPTPTSQPVAKVASQDLYARIAALEDLGNGQAGAAEFLALLHDMAAGWPREATCAVPLTTTLWLLLQANGMGPNAFLEKCYGRLKLVASCVLPAPDEVSRRARDNVKALLNGRLTRRVNSQTFAQLVEHVGRVRFDVPQEGLSLFWKKLLDATLPELVGCLKSRTMEAAACPREINVETDYDGKERLLALVDPDTFTAVMAEALARLKQAKGRLPKAKDLPLAQLHAHILKTAFTTFGSSPKVCRTQLLKLHQRYAKPTR